MFQRPTATGLLILYLSSDRLDETNGGRTGDEEAGASTVTTGFYNISLQRLVGSDYLVALWEKPNRCGD